MRLICHITFMLWFTVKINSQKFTQEQFPFPPHFKSSNPPNGVYGSDKSIYLPPESHTAIPYYSINNSNKLPFHFLPPTATKAPSVYPTPFPMVISSTMEAQGKRDYENENEDKSRISHSPIPSFRKNIDNNNNQTNLNNEYTQEREMKSIPKNFNFQHPVDRIDIKFSPQMHTATQKSPVSQTPASQRRMIISTEILKNDQGSDQIRRASILGSQFNTPPAIFYSTTEPAIPILRLSNEMDLDGSFSYEALGADQTHYVQHSRMENSGTDKEEQVVEGSYSYVGDNGQTYTVHYVADSNGYRASGDHLPVPPPIPEIIQRAIQYNLAEEAKKPAHLKSWQENEKDSEHGESEKHRFSILPPRNLFTGRTPEAFSFGLTQSSLLQNKVANDEHSQATIKTNFDFSSDPNKGKIDNGPITPQITFLASQGAHKPSLNTGYQQNPRVFATEKPNLPQLMNYEAHTSESEQDNNKALWRWQYGLNANGAIENQQPNKNSISRSFGEGDDVIINFNNMSPEQYTKMMKNDFLENNTEYPINENEYKNKNNINKNLESEPTQNPLTHDNDYITVTNLKETMKIKGMQDDYKDIENTSSNEHQSTATETTAPFTISSDWSRHMENMQNNNQLKYLSNFVTSTSLSPKSYGNSDITYEFPNITPFNNDITIKEEQPTDNGFENTKNNVTTFSPSDSFNHDSHIKFTDFIQKEEENKFKPIVNVKFEEESAREATTTESNPESIIRENIFLKNLFKEPTKTITKEPEATEEPKKQHNTQIKLEPKFDKIPKLIQYQSKPLNEIKNVVKKPLDITDVLNYITLKNHFESSKLNTKNKFSNSDKLHQRYERPQIFTPLESNRQEEEEQLDQEETQNNLRVINNQKQQDLRGIIKNYKVLQRNGNTKNLAQNEDQVMTVSSRFKTFQSQNLPPLGRAGPSMKSYLPPTYL